VATQSIDPGARVRKGSDIVLHLSSGLPIRTVPSVARLSLADALKALQDRGFNPDVKHRYSQVIGKGDVISQTPSPTARIEYGSPVHLVVSDGPEPVKVQDLVGRTGDDAAAILRAAGFEVERIDRFSDTVPRGDVIRQHPAHGTAPKGSTVTIVVSKGPRTFPLPNVAAESCGGAEQALSALGLDVHTVLIPSSSGNTVVGQNPSPGTTMRAGERVAIYCA
jgi:serine/threonine-protein kinase